MNLADMREKYEGLPPTWFEFLLDDSLVVKHLKLLESNQKGNILLVISVVLRI